MIGIYKIENRINHNCYIGQSIDINKRIHQHFSECWKEHRNDYKYPLHGAIRKYGAENFEVEILEECDTQELDEREIYWIAYYDSYNNGYNQTIGGKALRNGNHLLAKLGQGEVEEIRLRWAECNISNRELYLDYADRIGKSGFKKIISWQTWSNILPELNTPERRRWHCEDKNNYKNTVHHSGSIKYLTQEEVLQIRSLHTEANKPYDVYLKYNFDSKIGYDGFKDVWYGRSYKNIKEPVSTISVVGE